MAKKTKAEQIDEIKNIGKEIDFDFVLTPQAKNIIERIDNFPFEHFKAWWKKNFGVINGQQLHMYFSVEDGINKAKKGE